MQLSQLYEEDELLWYEKSAELIRAKKFTELDYEHIAEALETMGKREIQTIISQFSLLFMYLLKWKYQENYQCRSWQITIKRERRNIKEIMAYYPSLKGHLNYVVKRAYEIARYDASDETHIEIEMFPEEMPFSVEQALQDKWLP